MASIVSTLAAPVRLSLRALDDLHSLARDLHAAVRDVQDVAEATRWAMQHRATAEAAVRKMDAKSTALLEVQTALVEEQALLLARIETLNAKLPSTEEVVGMVDEIRSALTRVAGAAEPIQGAAETIERVGDRLPGGRRRAARRG